MIVLNVRNVHEALPRALQIVDERGVRMKTRSGPVLMVPGGVTTVYERPWERVIFWSERDANPAFHLYEALWMLAGRNDLKPLVRYAKQMAAYSDDGEFLHGAYGHRWRRPGWERGPDQLRIIADRLHKNPNDRRCVLEMWDAGLDLERGSWGKDVPCNLTATFQVSHEGRLDLTVFCRSNDIVWGAYGANAVHFSMLQEFMANEINVPIGTYTQVSVNWHIYLEWYEKLRTLPRPSTYSTVSYNPYTSAAVGATPMMRIPLEKINSLLLLADGNQFPYDSISTFFQEDWLTSAQQVLAAHQAYRYCLPPEKYTTPLRILSQNTDVDWTAAMREWVERRYQKWQQKQ